MKDKIELPLFSPIYSTYHFQGPGSAVLPENSSLRNWYWNQVMILFCGQRFLSGLTTPELNINASSWSENPHLEQHQFDMRFAESILPKMIRNMLEKGFYVCFSGADDYYVQGKTWYHERHFIHDGMICGADYEDETFSIYAYDRNWIYQRFKTPQRSFFRGCKAAWDKGVYGYVCAIKPTEEQVPFQPEMALENIVKYLDSTLKKYPFKGEGRPYGIVVHDYIACYIERLIKEIVPYERMDYRVFRMIWEHKKAMKERLMKIENALDVPNNWSVPYEAIVSETNALRMLYASHHMKRRDSILPIIQTRLMDMKKAEENLLSEFTLKMEASLK